MPTEQEVAAASRALSAGLTLIAAFLGIRQWYERRARDETLSTADRQHYARQDHRRWAGVLTLAVIAICAFLGSRTTSLVQGKGNPYFLLLWIGVLGLILVLILLALMDWMATRRFARRHRKQLFRDSIDDIRRDRQRQAGPLGEGPAPEEDGEAEHP